MQLPDHRALPTVGAQLKSVERQRQLRWRDGAAEVPSSPHSLLSGHLVLLAAQDARVVASPSPRKAEEVEAQPPPLLG